METWKRTKKNYINWLTNTDLKSEFSKKIVFDGLSLWWLTKLVDRDNINEKDWYINLNKKLNKKKVNYKNIYFTFFFLLIKVFKNFFCKIISIIFINIFFKKNKLLKKKTILYTYFINIKKIKKNNFSDYQYGKFGAKFDKSKINFIELPENTQLFLNFFSIKKKLNKFCNEYIISQHNIKIHEVIKIYYIVIINLFYVLKILKKKNFFIISKINCKKILKIKLIESFFGSIQNQLIKGKSLENAFISLKCKNFITTTEFYPGSRALYYYAFKNNVKNIVSIQHGNHYDANIFLNIKKKEFSKINNFKLFSPQPNIIFCQGNMYYKKIKRILPHVKIFKIGILKTEYSQKYNIIQNKKIINLNKKSKILLLLGAHDWHSFISLLNPINLSKFDIYVSIHPVVYKKCASFFKKYFKHFFNFTNNDIIKFLNHNDYVIFSETLLGLELAKKKLNVFRIQDNNYIPLVDINDGVLAATSSKKINTLLKGKIKNNISLIKDNHFYSYDNKASKRLEKSLKKLNY